MIAEGIVLLRVKNLQQGRGRVSPKVDPDLIHLIHHEDRIVASGLLDRLDDPSRHGPHIGPAVSADLGLIPNSSQGDPDELSSQGPGDRFPEGGLPDPRRTDETEDRPPHLLFSLWTLRYSKIRSFTFSKL